MPLHKLFLAHQRFEINNEKMEVNLTDVFVQLDVFSKKVQKKSNRQVRTILLLAISVIDGALLFKAWLLNTNPMTNFHVSVRSDLPTGKMK